MDILSSDLALEDFLRQALKSPVRVMLERIHVPAGVVAARGYEAETDRLRVEIAAWAARKGKAA